MSSKQNPREEFILDVLEEARIVNNASIDCHQKLIDG